MNREIKFRAWDDGKMIYFKDIEHLSLEDYEVLRIAKFFCNIRNDSYIMQFTGLHDKNGKEIYEGDILKEEAPRGHKYKVWREKGGLVINQFSDDFYKPIDKVSFWSGLSDMQTISFVEGNLCVIGNIYEHPTLLTHAK